MFSRLIAGQQAAFWYIVAVAVVPLITLLVLGLMYLWQNQWLFFITVIWLAATVAGYLVFKFLGRKTAASTDAVVVDTTTLPTQLDKRADWTETDLSIWNDIVAQIEQLLEERPEWQMLPEVGIELLAGISVSYTVQGRQRSHALTKMSGAASKAAYGFSVPEILLVLAETSRRYRQLLLSHVPLAEKIDVSSMLSIYKRQDQIRTGANWLYRIRRTARLINPLAALMAELRDQLTDRLFAHMSDKVQHDLKRLLLQELAQVSMDLYSGRLKSSSEELQRYRSQAYANDVNALADPVEPLRVVIIGQVSTGKSSLVNALTAQLEAQTDVLPTTDRTTVHTLRWNTGKSDGSKPDGLAPEGSAEDVTPDTEQTLHLVDTVGLVDDKASVETCLGIAREADLLVWLVRATQPARGPDATLYDAFVDSFRQVPDRRPPPVLLLMTHVDKLSPKAEWEPPYDLNGESRKAQTIKLALESAIRQIGFAAEVPAIPVSLNSTYEPYNLDAVVAHIMLMHDEATLTQMARRRSELHGRKSSWQERWEQASRLGKVSGKVLVRSALGKDIGK